MLFVCIFSSIFLKKNSYNDEHGKATMRLMVLNLNFYFFLVFSREWDWRGQKILFFASSSTLFFLTFEPISFFGTLARNM